MEIQVQLTMMFNAKLSITILYWSPNNFVRIFSLATLVGKISRARKDFEVKTFQWCLDESSQKKFVT